MTINKTPDIKTHVQ